MSFGNDLLGFGYRALALVVSTALALACSGKSETRGDDDETGGTGGASFGGTGGVAGVGGSGATTSTGGTGASSASCVSLCQGLQACPGAEPLDCASECANSETQAKNYGCASVLDAVYSCMAASGDLCAFDPETMCTNEVNAFIGCMTGDAGCTEGALPTGTSCTTLCERANACSGETADCAMNCADAAADIAAAGCTDSYQRYLDCAGTCENICNLSEDDCPNSYSAFVQCFSNF